MRLAKNRRRPVQGAYREGHNTGDVFLDETNGFNYIKKGDELPQNGKNKQYRNHIKQVCMGLTVSEDNVPFIYEIYGGGINTMLRYSLNCRMHSQKG